jgi:hypothetical protein
LGSALIAHLQHGNSFGSHRVALFYGEAICTKEVAIEEAMYHAIIAEQEKSK